MGAAICRILEYRPQSILVSVKIFSLKSQSFQAKTPLKADIMCVLRHFLLGCISLWATGYWHFGETDVKPVV